METNDLQNIWKKLDVDLSLKTKEELNQVLTKKSRHTVNQFLAVIAIATLVCVGMITFLSITALNRPEDVFYQLNNLVLGLVTVIALISSLFSWYQLQHKNYELSLRIWLEERIGLLSKWLTGINSKLYFFLIPVIYILTVLSIHVYFEHKAFVEVIQTSESVVGLLVAAPIGLFVSYFLAVKIRKQHSEKLEFLKYLYDCLCGRDKGSVQE